MDTLTHSFKDDTKKYDGCSFVLFKLEYNISMFVRQYRSERRIYLWVQSGNNSLKQYEEDSMMFCVSRPSGSIWLRSPLLVNHHDTLICATSAVNFRQSTPSSPWLAPIKELSYWKWDSKHNMFKCGPEMSPRFRITEGGSSIFSKITVYSVYMLRCSYSLYTKY